MIKLQDFARSVGVSDRQIQRQIQKYAAEMEGHFERQGSNGTWIDEEGEAFLRSKMRQAPMVMYDGTNDRKMQDLEAEVAALKEDKEVLLMKVATVQDLLIQEKDKVQQALLAAAKVELLEAAAADRESKIQQAAADLQTAQEVALQAQAAQRAAELEAEWLRAELQAEKSKPIWARIFGR